MISKEGVISLGPLILSPEDPKVSDLKYHAPDKFLLKKLDSSFDEGLRELLADRRVIVEIRGFALTIEGEIRYDIKILEPEGEEYDFHWLLSDKDLDESFLHLGDNFQDARFIFIDE